MAAIKVTHSRHPTNHLNFGVICLFRLHVLCTRMVCRGARNAYPSEGQFSQLCLKLLLLCVGNIVFGVQLRIQSILLVDHKAEISDFLTRYYEIMNRCAGKDVFQILGMIWYGIQG